jgi:hypothetical protein
MDKNKRSTWNTAACGQPFCPKTTAQHVPGFSRNALGYLTLHTRLKETKKVKEKRLSDFSLRRLPNRQLPILPDRFQSSTFGV